jgi:hypothetical protein
VSKVWTTTCHTCERGVSQSSKCVVLRVWGVLCAHVRCVCSVWGEKTCGNSKNQWTRNPPRWLCVRLCFRSRARVTVRSSVRHRQEMADRRAQPTIYGVTPLMDQIATAPSDSSLTLIVATFLVGSRNTHMSGSFGKRQRSLESIIKGVDDMVARSPGLCNPGVRLFVIHDVETNVTSWRGATLVHFPPKVSVPTDRRWALVLRMLTERAWDCAFAVDLADVNVLRVPSCRALPPRLYIGSDGCSGGIRKWLRRKAIRTRLNSSHSARYLAFLGDPLTTILNAGVVGGPRSAFEPALRALVGRFRRHWAVHTNLEDGGDMILWNEVGLESDVVTGYPLGPVNYPMYGMFCGMHHSCRNASRANGICSLPERKHRVHMWVNQTRGQYWFGHKMRKSWLARQQFPPCLLDLNIYGQARTVAWKRYCACCRAGQMQNTCCATYCRADPAQTVAV